MFLDFRFPRRSFGSLYNGTTSVKCFFDLTSYVSATRWHHARSSKKRKNRWKRAKRTPNDARTIFLKTRRVFPERSAAAAARRGCHIAISQPPLDFELGRACEFQRRKGAAALGERETVTHGAREVNPTTERDGRSGGSPSRTGLKVFSERSGLR